MSSIQFNYYADSKGEQIIRSEIVEKFGHIIVFDYRSDTDLNFNNLSSFISSPNDAFLISSNKEKPFLHRNENGHINLYENPVMQYRPSRINASGVYVSGRIAYFAGNNYPNFKKIIQSLIRKLKKSVGETSSGGFGFLKLLVTRRLS